MNFVIVFKIPPCKMLLHFLAVLSLPYHLLSNKSLTVFLAFKIGFFRSCSHIQLHAVMIYI